jgi:osmotically-inducible protein OsmY
VGLGVLLLAALGGGAYVLQQDRGREATPADEAAVAETSEPSDALAVAPQAPSAPDVAELRTQVAAVLQQKGFSGIAAEVADDRTVRLSGTIDDPQRGAAALDAVRGVPGVASVSDGLSLSSAARAKQLNDALQAADFAKVTAAVGDDGVTTLSGTVASAADKERAQQLVMSQQGALAVVRNDIAVNAPAPATPPPHASTASTATKPAAPAPPAEPAKPRARLAGVWVGQVKGALLSYNVNLRLKDAGVGQLAGETAYSLGANVQCSGRVIVASITPELVTLNEELTQASLATCQFGGAIKMAPQPDGTYYVEWMSRTREGKVAYKGTLHRQ